jgi:hypothetical protein
MTRVKGCDLKIGDIVIIHEYSPIYNKIIDIYSIPSSDCLSITFAQYYLTGDFVGKSKRINKEEVYFVESVDDDSSEAPFFEEKEDEPCI